MASLGLVIPAYRPDVETLSAYVETLRAELDPAAVRIELDTPKAATVEALAGIDATVNVVPYRRGKGAAVTDGFEALGTDVLAFADADGSTPAGELARVVEPVRSGGADVAVGSRRHPDATVTSHQTFARRRLGDAFAWLARRLLDVKLYDYQCGAKAVTGDAWEQIRRHIYEPGFAWDVELVAVADALGLRVEEVPVTWHDRRGSTVAPVRASYRFARTLFTVRGRAKRLRTSRLDGTLGDHREAAQALIDREPRSNDQ